MLFDFLSLIVKGSRADRNIGKLALHCRAGTPSTQSVNHRCASRAAPPMRAGHKDLTVIMNRLIPDHGRFVALSIEGVT
jgi:hypothetical protein